MEQRKSDLKDFLKKVKELRGFGDMNSYQVVRDFKYLAEDEPDEKLDVIIEDLSNPQTYKIGKEKLIKKVEHKLKDL
ncbi:hypothetical protein [Pedobacter mendelii]|uniref:Uncharacterized protein n=1 Tax=Pedobacter mendelii TaxID=1908240 RepID=A0ABQ2BN45_9SPHI|nr:hypothetical protein [Pedobacter mendelii]GGI29119.1 hypothetical protein GCM10008119_36050 [Pedobacter mendelii]